jgi:signal transduction histidine kinase
MKTTTLKKRLLGILIFNLLMVVFISGAIIFVDHKTNTETIMKSHQLWLKYYSQSFLPDIKIGNTIALENRLQILVNGSYFTKANFIYDGKSILVERNNSFESPHSSLGRLLFLFFKQDTIEQGVFDAGNTEWAKIRLKVDQSSLAEQLYKKIKLLVTFFIAYTLILFGYIIKRVDQDTKELTSLLAKVTELASHTPKQNSTLSLKSPEFRIREWADIFEKFRETFDRLKASQQALQQQTVQSELVKLSKQVSHDIRSPLSALNMMLSKNLAIPEEHRLIMRNATQRINDIANSLLSKYKSDKVSNSQNDEPQLSINKTSTQLLAATIDSIISEKRIQYRERMQVDIVADFQKSYGLFVNINAIEFSRVVSNLINNSVEALSQNGKIHVQIDSTPQKAILTITDTGKGIPDNILEKLGKDEFSFGKTTTDSGGNGLGLNHAFKTVEMHNGSIKIRSKVGVGTTIVISLPRAQAPGWYIENIDFSDLTTLVTADDDQTIHQIWTERLSANPSGKINHFKIASIAELEAFINRQNSSNQKVSETLYLVDYEFLGQVGNGLDTIINSKIANQSILVTSRFDETDVINRVVENGIKMIPKALAPIVPVHF